MALFVKQDFSPPILSRKWIAMKFRPNMLLYNRHHVISILESGLLFREDSIEVEQESPGGGELWLAAGGGRSGWLTKGERVAAVVAVCACVAAFPPRSLNRTTLLYLAAYVSLPVSVRLIHRRLCRGALPVLLARMRDYLALARRAAACLRECKATRAQLGSVSSVLDSTHALLCRQQSELAVTMSRASSALLGNVPWLRSDVAWDAIGRDENDNLMKIHHAFLVVQSTLLKHIAMAHFMPSVHAQKLYKNHNERIYWIHNTLIRHLTEEFTENYETLERMYRLLKNYGNADLNAPRKPGDAIKDTWLYSDVHNDIARTNLELKVALNKCNNLDLFLDSCALHKQELDLEVLNKDIDNLIENIIKSLTSAQSSQIRLKKLLSKFTKQNSQAEKEIEMIEEDDKSILKIEDREPETKDEVFYFVKTDDDTTAIQPSGDVTTGPGKKEKDATKIVLNELRRKLVNREDVMRERERQALAKTMPEFKDNVPEFPRQIKIEDYSDKKGYITKLKKAQNCPKKKLFRKYKIQSKPKNIYKYRLKINEYEKDTDIKSSIYEANSKLNVKSKLITFSKDKTYTVIYVWHKKVYKENNMNFSDLSDGLSDVETAAINKNIHEVANFNNNFKQNGDARNFKFSKRDLELSPSSSEDDSDMELYKEKMALLKDVRKHRPMRKKTYPDKRASLSDPSSSSTQLPEPADESLKPAQYSLGAGLAMASVLQVNSARFPTMAQEEVFIGDGEVSEDSGNDEDA